MSGMASYFLRRLILVPITFLAITLMVYAILRVVPGGPIEQAEAAIKMAAMSGEGGGSSAGLGDASMDLDEESMRELMQYYSLDKPILIGYLQWLGLIPREFATRVPRSTLDREKDAFEPLRRLQAARAAAQGKLDEQLAKMAAELTTEGGPEQGFIAYAGRVYSLIPEVERTRPATPKDIAKAEKEGRPAPERVPTDYYAQAAELAERGIAKRDHLIALLAKDARTWKDGEYYQLVTAEEEAKHPELFAEAHRYIDAVRVAREELARIKNELGYEIMEDGRIQKVEMKLAGILQLDFGRSTSRGERVLPLIFSKMQISLWFGLTGYFLTWFVCIPLGVFKALKHGSVFDTVSSAIVFLAYSMPGFVLCLILLASVAVNVDWIPLAGHVPDNIEELTFWQGMLARARHMIIPVTGYIIGSFATMTILMKNSLLENLNADYVRTAFAKGMKERRVIFIHALRNSLIPITAGIGHAIGLIFAGSFLIEKTCNVDGMGLLGFEAIQNRDYPIILGVLVFGVLIRLMGNILSDVIWALIDPRIRFE